MSFCIRVHSVHRLVILGHIVHISPTSEPHGDSFQTGFMAYQNITFILPFVLGLSFLNIRL